MPNQPQFIYWDSCVFLSLLDGIPARLPAIEGVLLEVARSKGDLQIITSTFTVAEVAYVANERLQGQLDPVVENRINDFWKDTSVFKLVEFHYLIALDARDLIRDVLVRAPGLKPKDAVHLATARRMGAIVFHTYDGGLFKYSSDVGFQICNPVPSQPTLFQAGSP